MAQPKQRNAALDALMGNLSPGADVVQLNPDQDAPAASPPAERSITTAEPKPAKPTRQGRQKPQSRGRVVETYKRVTLYLPPEAKRKFEEIAFYEKATYPREHDIYISILAEWLKRKGHPGLL